MAKISDPWTSRQQHQLAYISEYTTDIQHIQGKDNPVADALFRATLATIQEGIDYTAMANSQKNDPEVQAYCTADSSLKLEDIPFGTKGTTLLCDTSAGQPQAHNSYRLETQSIRPNPWPIPSICVGHTKTHGLQCLFGMAYRNRWEPGPRRAFTAKPPRRKSTSEPHWRHSRYLLVALTTYMWIW